MAGGAAHCLQRTACLTKFWLFFCGLAEFNECLPVLTLGLAPRAKRIPVQVLARLESSNHKRYEALGLSAIGLVAGHSFGKQLLLTYGVVNGWHSDDNNRNNEPRVEA